MTAMLPPENFETEPWETTPYPDELDFDQLAHLIDSIDPEGFYATAAAFDLVRDGLAHVLDRFRSVSQLVEESLTGESAEGFAGAARAIRADIAEHLYLMQEPGYSVLLRKAGDVVTQSQQRMRALQQSRTEHPDISAETGGEDERQLALRLVNDVQTCYLDVGTAMAPLPPGGGGGASGTGDPTTGAAPGGVTGTETGTPGGNGVSRTGVGHVTYHPGGGLPVDPSAVRHTAPVFNDGSFRGEGGPTSDQLGEGTGWMRNTSQRVAFTADPATSWENVTDVDGEMATGTPFPFVLGPGSVAPAVVGKRRRSATSGGQDEAWSTTVGDDGVLGRPTRGEDVGGESDVERDTPRTTMTTASEVAIRADSHPGLTSGGDTSAHGGAAPRTVSSAPTSKTPVPFGSERQLGAAALPVRPVPGELTSLAAGVPTVVPSGTPGAGDPSAGAAAGQGGSPGYGMAPMALGAAMQQPPFTYRSEVELEQESEVWRVEGGVSGALGRPEPPSDPAPTTDEERYLGAMAKFLRKGTTHD